MTELKINKEGRVDIFDFDAFPKEKAVFEHFYSDIEFHLRFAVFISYNYVYLRKNNKDVMNIAMSRKTGKPLRIYRNEEGQLKGIPIEKEYLDLFTSVFENYAIVKRWYYHYNPDKYMYKEEIEEFLGRYHRIECVAFNRMYKAHVDPSWVMRPLWFSKKNRTTSKGVKVSMIETYENLNKKYQ